MLTMLGVAVGFLTQATAPKPRTAATPRRMRLRAFIFFSRRQKEVGAAACRRPNRSPRRLESGGEVGVDGVEDAVDGRAEQGHGGDTNDGDQADEDAVLDQRGAGLVLNETRQKLLHTTNPP